MRFWYAGLKWFSRSWPHFDLLNSFHFFNADVEKLYMIEWTCLISQNIERNSKYFKLLNANNWIAKSELNFLQLCYINSANWQNIHWIKGIILQSGWEQTKIS